jgi:hypothetical protein
MTDYSREQIIDEIESFYCDRMVSLVGANNIADADALHSEFAGHSGDDFEWIFLTNIEDVC